jgi:hypothetical protein
MLGALAMKWANVLFADLVRAFAAVALVLCPMAACAAEGPATGGAADAFDKALAGCSEQTGYFPESSDSLRPYELAPREREWAACAYAQIEQHVATKSPVPDQYRRLIVRHRELTDAVEAQRATRSQRRSEILATLEAIRDVESLALAQKQKELEQVQNYQEQQRLMRDVDRMQRDAIRAQQTIRVRVR